MAPVEGRGHYKIFLGMAAGVGKTYRMLQEGQAERAAGRDVLIGYLEPHERPETATQAAGLEELPRRSVEYRGHTVHEMDLPAIFRRAPELCLIDELAHSNPPGLEHAKRYEDIEDVLDAGIDVYSTVNIQHLETLNDRVHELTGVTVRETFPDSVLTSADEVVLVDLTPEALTERLRDGKVYPRQRIATALESFFKVENLSALRELALREVAEDVESKRLVTPRRGTGNARGTAVRGATVASRRPHPGAGQAGRPLQSPGAPRVALGAAARGGARPPLRRAARRATTRREARTGRGAATARLDPGSAAHRRGGRRSRRGRGASRGRARHDLRVHGAAARRADALERLRESSAERLMRKLPGVDVRILSDAR